MVTITSRMMAFSGWCIVFYMVFQLKFFCHDQNSILSCDSLQDSVIRCTHTYSLLCNTNESACMHAFPYIITLSLVASSSLHVSHCSRLPCEPCWGFAAKYAKIHVPTYWMRVMKCSWQGYRAEYVDIVACFGVFCLFHGAFRTHPCTTRSVPVSRTVESHGLWGAYPANPVTGGGL